MTQFAVVIPSTTACADPGCPSRVGAGGAGGAGPTTFSAIANHASGASSPVPLGAWFRAAGSSGHLSRSRRVRPSGDVGLGRPITQ